MSFVLPEELMRLGTERGMERQWVVLFTAVRFRLVLLSRMRQQKRMIQRLGGRYRRLRRLCRWVILTALALSSGIFMLRLCEFLGLTWIT